MLETEKLFASNANTGTWQCLFCGQNYPAATFHACDQAVFAKINSDDLEQFRRDCLYAAITGLCVTYSTRSENASKMPRCAPRIVEGIICQANELADAAVAFEDQRRKIVAGIFAAPLQPTNPENSGSKLKPGDTK